MTEGIALRRVAKRRGAIEMTIEEERAREPDGETIPDDEFGYKGQHTGRGFSHGGQGGRVVSWIIRYEPKVIIFRVDSG